MVDGGFVFHANPAPQAPQQIPIETEYFANQDVIIYSQSMGGWVPARIVSTNADDSVTVRYETGHTKLVPLEYQATHLRPASSGSPPPEPTPMLGLGHQPSLPSFMDVQAAGNPMQPGFGGSGAPNLFGTPGLGQAQSPQSQYRLGEDAMIWSDSARGWVAAKVTAISPEGHVTVQYGGNQKTVLAECQHTHLRKMNAPGPAPPLVQPKFVGHGVQPKAVVQSAVASHVISSAPTPARVVSAAQLPAPSAPAATPVSTPGSGVPYAQSMYVQSKDIRLPSSQDYSNNYAPAPPQQAGTFTFDLSQLCADAKMQ